NGKVADASQEASTQQAAAEQFGVSRSSVQRARKVVESGSRELQKAVESGQVGLTKAASVVDKPKAEQLRAAQAPDPADEEPEENEAERIESMQREYLASIEKVMGADDKLSAAHEELKRQAAEIATLKISRDHWQNKCATLTRRVQSLQNKCDRLEKGN
ncbi:MAG: hypothetical protein KGL39_47325, partial [Patescibacteria group bacterium]|nr:hypothetical protein [Patescibacteria group bacterium]